MGQTNATTGAGEKVGQRVSGCQGETFVLNLIIDLTCLLDHTDASATTIPCQFLQVLPIKC